MHCALITSRISFIHYPTYVLEAKGGPFYRKMAEWYRRWIVSFFSEEKRIHRGLGDQTREEEEEV